MKFEQLAKEMREMTDEEVRARLASKNNFPPDMEKATPEEVMEAMMAPNPREELLTKRPEGL